MGLLALSLSCKSTSQIDVLFVGNSYTFVNDLPARLGSLDQRIRPRSRTTGGAALAVHIKDGVVEFINANRFDYVVIQGHSLEALKSPKRFLEDAAKIANAAKARGATPIFYQTWPRQKGHEIFSEPWSGGTPKQMQVKLLSAYREATKRALGKLAPVGLAFSLAEDRNLYMDDGSHPTPEGTELAACVLYAVITGKPPKQATLQARGITPALCDIANRALTQLERD